MMIRNSILFFSLLFLTACSDGICKKKYYLLEYCEEWLDGPLIVDEN